MNETTPPIMAINDELLAELEQLAGNVVSLETTEEPGIGSAYDSFESKANPATILALLQHVRELKADANNFREIVCAVVREIPHRDTSRGNAPGHGHSIAGVWDEDNGALAGTECAWCKTWHSAVDAARSSAD